MDQSERERLIAQYAAGFREVSDALAGITTSELDARLAPDDWTPREIVHHLADSEMEGAMRLRRLLAEERPTLVGYDQEAFARRLAYDRPIAAALIALQGARETTAELLRRLTAEDWQREGEHTEYGRYTLDDWLRIYAAHAHEHAEQIRRIREALQQA